MGRISIPILLIGIVLIGCGSSDDMYVNEFIKENGRPVIVKRNEKYITNYYTLTAPNGKILLIENTTLSLPDTIK